jgi:hypothetical protein
MAPETPQHRRRPQVVRKARADTRDLSVTAVLTWPGPDLVGDVVRPAGLDFSGHATDPWNDLEHNGQCVGWARKSLSRPGGPYGLEWLTIEGHRLPVGTTWFDPSDALSAQVFGLVAEDALPGVSLEFVPVRRKALGPGPHGTAYAYDAARVVRWCHCARPVNEGATVAKSASAGPRATDKLLSVLSAGRLGSEPLHPTITKAFAEYLPPKRLVRVEKAMDEMTTAYDDQTPPAEPAPEPEPEADAGGSATEMAANNFAQGLTDLCAAARSEAEGGEHVKGRKKLAKLIADVESYVEDAVKIGMEVKKDLASVSLDEPADDAEPAEPEVSEDDLQPDADGTLKCFSPSVKKALKRYTLKTIEKAREAEQATDRESDRLLRDLKKSIRRSGG